MEDLSIWRPALLEGNKVFIWTNKEETANIKKRKMSRGHHLKDSLPDRSKSEVILAVKCFYNVSCYKY